MGPQFYKEIQKRIPTIKINSRNNSINATHLTYHYNNVHCFFDLGFGLGHKTARMASSKTVFSPFCVKAEHSKYLTERISLAIAKPWG